MRTFMRILPLLATAGAFAAPPAFEPNYDEAKIPPHTLPDPLKGEDGTPVKSAAEWTSKRRGEILALFETNVYGKTPEVAKRTKLTARPGKTVSNFLNGKATLREAALILPSEKGEIALNLMIVTPNAAKGAVPAFLGLNFKGNHSIHPDPRITLSTSWMRPDKEGGVVDNRATEACRGIAQSRWPLEKIIDRGYALATMYYGDIDPDFDDGFENGIHAAFGKPGPEEWGSIGAWSWGLSRALDYLETDTAINAKQVAVLGHSRLGKTSLWAGAQDERFGIVISNDSGCGGAALSRRAIGETVGRINTSFPHWFCDRFLDYNENENACPVDQHELIALMAPRPVYVASAVEDTWADPKGEFLSAKLAGPVYALFGKNGVGVEEQPGIDHPVGDAVGYHIRTGKHDVTDFDWEQYLSFADRHFARK
ncbi:MAG: acetylxylan esterase [Verrucomicrobiae bacterium]|nr:acetylxylan esterase [Verrucomicrobiae bacterium]